MNLRVKFYLITISLHLVLLIAGYVFLGEDKALFLLVEVFLLCSLALFLALIRKVLAPFDYVDLFNKVLNEQEFTTRFSHTGNRELDNLMLLFNQMLEQLYQERLKLGDRQGMLQQLMNAIPLNIIVFDYDNKVSQLNPAAQSLFAVSSEEAEGLFVHQLPHAIAQQLANVSSGSARVITDSSGKRFQCYQSQFRDRGFERRFYLVQELTTALKASERRTYDKLIRLMSHEVNNTIAATSSVLKSCLHYSDQIDQEEREDFITAMDLVIARTDNLNSFMQEYSQIVRLPKPLKSQCNLRQMLMSIERLFAQEMEDRQITFSVEQASELLSDVSIDQAQIEQVLINIVRNSIDAIEREGTIKVTLSEQQNKLVLQVVDSGHGVSSEATQQLFTPFFTTKAHGQGIGLMLAAEILDAHQCSYALYNHASGGACFEIAFLT